MVYEVEVFTPKKTWKQLVKSDLKRMNLSMSDALNYNKCRNLLRGGWRGVLMVGEVCVVVVKSSPPTNQHPVFYRSDALPVAQPTVSKH